MTSSRRATAWRGWTGLAACAGLFLIVYVHRFVVGTLAGSLMAEFGATAVELGTLASLYFYLYGLTQVPAGIMADTLGPRRTLLLSGACLAVGAALSASAPALPAAYLGRFLVGLGAGPVFVCGMRLIASWFDPWRFATLVGLLNMVGNFGGFLAGAPLAIAADALGWRGVLWGLAALTLSATLTCWGAVRDRPRVLPAEAITLRASLRSAARAFGNREIWKALIVKTGIDASLFVFFAAWGVPYLSQVYGIPAATASRYVSIAILGFALGSPSLGVLSDRVFRDRRRPIVLAGTVYTALWLVVLFPPTGAHGPALFALATFVMGFASACLLLTLSVARDQVSADAVGVTTAVVNGSGFLGGAILQLVASAILDALWDGAMAGGARVYSVEAFRAAFLTCLGAAAVAVVAALRLREPASATPPAR